MISDDEFDPFAHLDTYQNPGATVGSKPKAIELPVSQRHPCHECAGTGFYRGVRIHQEKSQCFACKGKGYFKKSYSDRLKARGQAAARKVKKTDEVKAGFREANKGLIESLEAIASWHQFAASMIASFNQYGSLTDKQVTALWSALARVEAKRAEREAAKLTKTGEVDVTAINAMFASATASGLKRPRFLTDRLDLSLASANGKNPGAVYVKCDKEYAGKIVAGKFVPVNSAPADILELVRNLAASPIKAAKEYGRLTGRCSCCGRTLTDKRSVELGIGPICESKWGI